MKIKLLQDHPIKGSLAAADTVVDVNKGCADDLVARGIAEPISKKPAKKKADS